MCELRICEGLSLKTLCDAPPYGVDLRALPVRNYARPLSIPPLFLPVTHSLTLSLSLSLSSPHTHMHTHTLTLRGRKQSRGEGKREKGERA